MKKKLLAIVLTILGSLTLTAYDNKGVTAEAGNLDGLGPWGAIPCTEEVASILLKNQDEDYIIEFHDDSDFGIFSNTGEILGMCKADWYSCESYNQEGYMKNTGVYQGDNRYVYYSKPVTAQECAEFAAADALIKEMACDYIMSDNEKLAIQIGGSTKSPSCRVGTTYVEVNDMGSSAVKAKGNTLLIKANPLLYTYESITEVQKFGNNLMVYIRVYTKEDKVNFENYLEKPTCIELFGTIDLKNGKPVPENDIVKIIGAQ